MQYMLNKKELTKAKKEKAIWEKKAVYWHNAIPNFDYNLRSSLTKDVETIVNYEQLELNKEYS